MPIYEFRCKKCDKKFEELVFSLNSEKKIICLQCGSKESERLFSSFSSKSSGSLTTTSCSPRGGFT